MENLSNPALFGKDAPQKVPLAREVADAEYPGNGTGNGNGEAQSPATYDDAKMVTPRVFVKAVLINTLHRLGGSDWLFDFVKRDDQNARTYLAALTKLLPTELTGPGGSPLTIVIRKEGQEVEGRFEGGRFIGAQTIQGEVLVKEAA